MKTLKSLFLIVVLVFLASSCTHESLSKLDFKELSASKVESRVNETEPSFDVDLKIEFPIGGIEDSLLQSIQRTLVTDLLTDKFVGVAPDQLLNSYLEACYSDYKILTNDFNDSPVTVNYTEKLNAVPLYVSDKLLTYEATRYLYQGGAHGLETTFCWVFDLASGQQITEADIFVPNYEEPLTQLLIAALNAHAAKIGVPITEYWVAQVAPNGNFAITEEGIIYQYNPYDIAPYVQGSTRLLLPKQTLLPLLKEHTSVYELYAL